MFASLALWNNVTGTMVVEIVMFVAGVIIYANATKAKDAIGRWAFWALAGFLLVFYALSSLYPTVPPSAGMIWISAIVATGVILLWTAWIDRHRTAT